MGCESALVFAADHPAFAGHFPGMPIVPGVLLLDAALHALAGHSGRPVAEIAVAKFLRPVGPAQILAMSCECSDAGRGRFTIAYGDQPAATGQLVLGAA
jgi:3-hydroxyacyl-[acyl-carrier-protein] dehydratase